MNPALMAIAMTLSLVRGIVYVQLVLQVRFATSASPTILALCVTPATSADPTAIAIRLCPEMARAFVRPDFKANFAMSALSVAMDLCA